MIKLTGEESAGCLMIWGGIGSIIGIIIFLTSDDKTMELFLLSVVVPIGALALGKIYNNHLENN